MSPVKIRSPWLRIFALRLDHSRASAYKISNIDIYIDDDLIAVARYIFLHHDGICSGRHGRAGKNPDRRALPVETRSCRSTPAGCSPITRNRLPDWQSLAITA